MAHENVIEKYGITEEEMKKGLEVAMKGVTQISDSTVMLAVTDLLANGDIKEDKQ